jgi:hypothetical protein
MYTDGAAGRVGAVLVCRHAAELAQAMWRCATPLYTSPRGLYAAVCSRMLTYADAAQLLYTQALQVAMRPYAPVS